MEMLRSSILGREFVNYRKSTVKDVRLQFSHKVRSQGIGNIPIVVDSVDKELTEAIGERKNRYSMYGKELVFHMDCTVGDVMKEIKIILVEKEKEHLWKETGLVLGLEDGTILQPSEELGGLYKKHRNKDDKILYLLLTREQTMYGYIMSILKYLGETIVGWFRWDSNKTEHKHPSQSRNK